MPIGQGLPSPIALLFNRPKGGLMPELSRHPIHFDIDDDNYDALIKMLI